jgi:1-deoxy-D-xylulose-5-phosphate reductoisomerase
MKQLAILGSTGSIGTSALEVVAAFPDDMQVVGLAAGQNLARLAEQIVRFRPRLVSVQRDEDRAVLRGRLPTADQAGLEILCGLEGAVAVAADNRASHVLSAMVGAQGLAPTLAALRRGATVALANKESLVMAGALCLSEAKRSGATLLPVDSEHSAIHQSLQGHRREDVRRLLLTGSGGPFRTVENLEEVTVEQALRHPTWSMGPKITIDSATLMNKGLEVIEAHWLFDMPAEQVQILIHPESIVHSLVEYVDGSLIAQLGLPDMRLPISYALGHPGRLPLPHLLTLDLARLGQLTFEAPRFERFPCLSLAYGALRQGDTFPAVLNAANEVAVEAFLQRRVRFTMIPRLIEQTLACHVAQREPSLPALLEADRWARQQTLTQLSSSQTAL